MVMEGRMMIICMRARSDSDGSCEERPAPKRSVELNHSHVISTRFFRLEKHDKNTFCRSGDERW